MAFNGKVEAKGVPEGKIVPMYLTEAGELYSLRYKDEEQLELVSVAISRAISVIMDGKVVIENEPVDTTGVFKVQDMRKKEN